MQRSCWVGLCRSGNLRANELKVSCVFRKKGFIVPLALRDESPSWWWRPIVVQSRKCQSHLVQIQEAQRWSHLLLASSLSPFYIVWDPCPWDGATDTERGSTVKRLWNTPTGMSRGISEASLSPFKMTVKIKCSTIRSMKHFRNYFMSHV